MTAFTRKTALVLAVLLTIVLAGSVGSLWAADTVNINTATVEELTQLDRVGTKYAERIVAYREANGPFKKPEDILDVQGIGPKTWEVNKDRIVVK